MSQMFLFNNLIRDRELLKAGVNPACSAPGHDPREGCAGTGVKQVDFPLGLRYPVRKFKKVHLVKEINNLKSCCTVLNALPRLPL